MEKSEAEPLSDISERTEDISDEMRDSGKGDKIRRKASLIMDWRCLSLKIMF